jgi:uncharacterized protein YcfL
MRRSAIVHSAIVVLLVIMACSCGPYRIKGHREPLQEKEKMVLIEHEARRYLRLVKHDAERLPNGQLKVKLEIENKKEATFHADVQFIFRDEKGFQIEETNWQPILFHGRRVTLVEQNSITPKAADYRVLIRVMK